MTLGSRDMRAEEDAKNGERVCMSRQAEAGAFRRLRAIKLSIHPSQPTPLQYRHNGRRLESRWSQVSTPRSTPRHAELGADGRNKKSRRLIVGFDSQLQPLHGRRRPCCPPLAQGGQEIGCRAQRRDGPEICQVGGALYLIRRDPYHETHATPRTLHSVQRQSEHHR
jgi:hypothetical protein